MHKRTLQSIEGSLVYIKLKFSVFYTNQQQFYKSRKDVRRSSSLRIILLCASVRALSTHRKSQLANSLRELSSKHYI